MRQAATYLFFLFLAAAGASAQQRAASFTRALDDDESKFTSVGNIRLTITNFGTLGHGFNKWPQQPNCEYPAGSGIEHLFEGGLWVGAYVRSQGPFVSTGAVDVSSVRDIAAGFEFTTAQGASTQERSSLPDSRFYSPDAVSHQDFTADFTDSNTVVPGTSTTIPEHTTPLDVVVHMESYAWNFSFAENFVILRYTITNRGSAPLDSVYTGLWIDMVVRNTNLSPPRGSSFFARGGNGFVDSLRLAYEFDVDGDPGFTDSYIGLSVLGSEPLQRVGRTTDGRDSLGARCVYNPWQFRNTTDPLYFSPVNDRERYEKMALGLPRSEYTGLRAPSNRSTLLTTGPFTRIGPDSSITVVFAVVCARKFGTDATALDTEPSRANLYRSLSFARQAYDGEDKNRNGALDAGEDLNADGRLTRYVLPAPPSPPRVRCVPGDRRVTLYWDASAEASIDPISGTPDFEGYRVYRSNPGDDLHAGTGLSSSLILAAEFDRPDDAVSYNTGFNRVRLETPMRFPGDATEYRYRFEVPDQLNGWQYMYSVTAFDAGDPANSVESLESSRLQNARRVVPGTTPPAAAAEPRVYPNPYYVGAQWDGSGERLRKLTFANIPRKAEIRIYTVAGDLVRTLIHDADTYNGADAQWYTHYGDGTQTLSGGEHAWDLVTDNDQAIATGLYLFTVENKETGDISRGKFAIIK